MEIIKAMEMLLNASKDDLKHANNYIIENWPEGAKRSKALDTVQKVLLPVRRE